MSVWSVNGVNLSEDNSAIIEIYFCVDFTNQKHFECVTVEPQNISLNESQLLDVVKSTLGSERVSEIEAIASNPLRTYKAFPLLTDAQILESDVRSERDSRLAKTDFFALSDVTMSEDMAAYRTALRDVPQQEGFPSSISWPLKP